jgi:hypothetical protein
VGSIALVLCLAAASCSRKVTVKMKVATADAGLVRTSTSGR